MTGCFVGGLSGVRLSPRAERCVCARAGKVRVSMGEYHIGYEESDRKKLDEMAEGSIEVYEGPPPGKMKVEGAALAEQKAALNALSEQWKKERLDKEFESAKLFGWTNRAEDLNCRFAMFGIMTGYLTELYTGQTIPEQVETLFRTLGVI